ncbi:hypothetical protein BASA83_010287 [Batrachochytrium salamandrivorans]|nr:hypothetical protein BASA83_010287 [Batrachochytrium salamandrivorans]
MLKTLVFYVTSLCHGIFLGILGWRDTTLRLIGSPEWWILAPIIAWRIVALGRLEFKDLESLQVPRISRPSIVSRNQKPSDQTSDFAADPDIDLSLFKGPSMDLDLGIKLPVLRVSNGTSKSVSFAETIQAEVYPFLEVSPVSVTPIPLEDRQGIFKHISPSLKPTYCASHRSLTATINLSPSAEPSYGRIYQLPAKRIRRRNRKQPSSPNTDNLISGNAFGFSQRSSAVPPNDELVVSSHDQENNLFCKAEKCHFIMTEIKYLGYIIHQMELPWTRPRFLLSRDWPAPKKEVKGRIRSTRILAHPNDEQPFILETDASDFAISGVLHQHDQSNTLRPGGFYFKTDEQR